MSVLLVAGCQTAPPPPEPEPSAVPVTGLRVEGNRLVEDGGAAIRLRGFNHSGAEYSCIEGNGFFDTDDGQAPGASVVRAMRRWHGANAVRVPLNEQCWLGLPAAPSAYAGEKYRASVRKFVQRLNAYGFVAVLDLHRSAPAGGVSKQQEQMPDRDHSVDFWKSVAGAFPTGAVVFDLFNEPFPYAETDTDRAWACWRDGGCTLTSVNSGQPYVAAGMNELIAAVRGHRVEGGAAGRRHPLGRVDDALAQVPAGRPARAAGGVVPRVLVQRVLRRTRPATTVTWRRSPRRCRCSSARSARP